MWERGGTGVLQVEESFVVSEVAAGADSVKKTPISMKMEGKTNATLPKFRRREWMSNGSGQKEQRPFRTESRSSNSGVTNADLVHQIEMTGSTCTSIIDETALIRRNAAHIVFGLWPLFQPTMRNKALFDPAPSRS